MPSEPLELECTKHAVDVIEERRIPVEWVERVMYEPELRTPDPPVHEVERFYRTIPELGDRVLRVAMNTRSTDWRVISVFFDRNMRGKL